MAWLTTSSATNEIVMEEAYSWDYREIGWSYGTARIEYVVKRKKYVNVTRWVGMDLTTSKAAASAKLTGDALSSIASRENAGGAYSVVTSTESYPDGSSWILVRISVRYSSDT